MSVLNQNHRPGPTEDGGEPGRLCDYALRAGHSSRFIGPPPLGGVQCLLLANTESLEPSLFSRLLQATKEAGLGFWG